MGSRQGYNPNEMERSKFEALVAQALDGLPKTFREKLTNVAIIVEDRPPQEPDGGLLLGLFHGIPRTEKSVFFSSPPDRIFLTSETSRLSALATQRYVGRFVRRCCTKWDITLVSVKTNYAVYEDRAAFESIPINL